MHVNLKSESLFANLMEVKASEAQGRNREVGSEGSMEQRCELTNRNWMSGGKVGRVSVRLRNPYPSKTGTVNSSSCAPKVKVLTPGDLSVCRKMAIATAMYQEARSEVRSGHSR